MFLITHKHQDCANHLYDSFHFNFASSISHTLLEDLASSALESGSVGQISKIFDQYINFISLDKDLFSLGQSNSYYIFNDPYIEQEKAEENIDILVDSLFSVLVTMVSFSCVKMKELFSVFRQSHINTNKFIV